MAESESDSDAMMALLEAAGERDIDIVPLVFDRFFARHPDTRELFPNLEAAAGRMVNETLDALVGLAENAWWVDTTIINFVDLHRNFGTITEAQWHDWIDMTIDTLAEAGGDEAAAASKPAWQAQGARMKAMIDA